MKKMRSRKGFTLMEMLIVLAIIAILVAIAVPVFSAQLSAAETRVQEANTRSAKSMAVAEYLLSEKTGAATYYVQIDAQDNMTVAAAAPAAGTPYVEVSLLAGGSVDSATYKPNPAP